jgi:hypothetical protein
MRENRTRKNLLKVFLSDSEQRALIRKKKQSGLNASALIRAMILDYKIKERPTSAYKRLYKELYLTCNNINQIAKAYNSTGIFDANLANETMNELIEMIRKLKE